MFNFINKIKNRKGFTLVELLVVLAVLAIISAIAIPRFAGVQENAKKKADNETISMIESALELWLVTENITLPADKAKVITFGKTDAYATASFETEYSSAIIDKYVDTAKIKLQHYASVIFEIDKNGSVKGTPTE